MTLFNLGRLFSQSQTAYNSSCVVTGAANSDIDIMFTTILVQPVKC